MISARDLHEHTQKEKERRRALLFFSTEMPFRRCCCYILGGKGAIENRKCHKNQISMGKWAWTPSYFKASTVFFYRSPSSSQEPKKLFD
jgi:hypothetical protein